MTKSKGISRRSFLRNTTLGVVGAGIISNNTKLTGQENNNPNLEFQKFELTEH
jgi:hypothetical protein